MEPSPNFVDVRDVAVNYRTSPGFLQLLSGRPGESFSALRQVSFQLPLGLHIAVFGHEGAGKTTLLRLLTGQIKPNKGSVFVNGQSPQAVKHIAAGYVSSEESEPRQETCHQVLSAYAATHGVDNSVTRISQVSDIVQLTALLYRPASALSTAARLRLNLARAALSDSPLVLLDDVADHLGSRYLAALLPKLFSGRTVLVATRQAAVADQLQLPLMLLHGGTLTHHGTAEEIAADLSCPRIIDVWIEGLRYDLLRKVRRHTGVLEARLIPSTQFAGQRLRITLRSSRYLPTLYDLVSQAPLIKVHELPPSLNDIIARL